MSESAEKPVTALMRTFIEVLAATGSWREAAVQANVSERTPRRWLKDHEGFKALYEEVIGKSDIGQLREQASLLAGKALNVFDESMDASRIVEVKVQCPECGERFTTEITVPNASARLRAAEDVSKISSLMIEKKEVTGKMVMIHELDGATRSALIAYDAGLPISPGMMQRLLDNGLIETSGPRALPPGATDGEFREVK